MPARAAGSAPDACYWFCSLRRLSIFACILVTYATISGVTGRRPCLGRLARVRVVRRLHDLGGRLLLLGDHLLLLDEEAEHVRLHLHLHLGTHLVHVLDHVRGQVLRRGGSRPDAALYCPDPAPTNSSPVVAPDPAAATGAAGVECDVNGTFGSGCGEDGSALGCRGRAWGNAARDWRSRR